MTPSNVVDFDDPAWQIMYQRYVDTMYGPQTRQTGVSGPAPNPLLDPTGYATYLEKLRNSPQKRRECEMVARQKLFEVRNELTIEEALAPVPTQLPSVSLHALTPRQATEHDRRKDLYLNHKTRQFRDELKKYDNDIAGREEAIVKFGDFIMSTVFGSDWPISAAIKGVSGKATQSSIYDRGCDCGYGLPSVGGGQAAQKSKAHVKGQQPASKDKATQKPGARSQPANKVDDSGQRKDDASFQSILHELQSNEAIMQGIREYEQEKRYQWGSDVPPEYYDYYDEYGNWIYGQDRSSHRDHDPSDADDHNDDDFSRDKWGDDPYDLDPTEGQRVWSDEEGFDAEIEGAMQQAILEEQARMMQQADKKAAKKRQKRQNQKKKNAEKPASEGGRKNEVVDDKVQGEGKALGPNSAAAENLSAGSEQNVAGSAAAKDCGGLPPRSTTTPSPIVDSEVKAALSLGTQKPMPTAASTASVGLGLAKGLMSARPFSHSNTKPFSYSFPQISASSATKTPPPNKGPTAEELRREFFRKSDEVLAKMKADAQKQKATESESKGSAFGGGSNDTFQMTFRIPGPSNFVIQATGTRIGSSTTSEKGKEPEKDKTQADPPSKSKYADAPTALKAAMTQVDDRGSGKRKKVIHSRSSNSTLTPASDVGSSSQSVKKKAETASTSMSSTVSVKGDASRQQDVRLAAEKGPLKSDKSARTSASASTNKKAQAKAQRKGQPAHRLKKIKFEVVVFKKPFTPSKRPHRDCWHGREWL